MEFLLESEHGGKPIYILAACHQAASPPTVSTYRPFIVNAFHEKAGVSQVGFSFSSL
jgi:hypothetical protein